MSNKATPQSEQTVGDIASIDVSSLADDTDASPDERAHALADEASDDHDHDPVVPTRDPIDATDHDAIAYFECPYCGYDDPDEVTVRWHITKSSDAQHGGSDLDATINGFSPTTNVIAYTDDGEEVDVFAGSPSHLAHVSEMGDVTTDILPSDVADDPVKRAILQTAVLNPTDSIADLHRKVNEKLTDQGDSEVAYATVRRHVKRMATSDNRPDGRTTTTGPDGNPKQLDADEKSWDHLTDLQKDAIDQLVRYRDDDKTQGEMAEEAGGFHDTNFTTVKKKYQHIIDTRTEAVESGEVELPPPGAHQADAVDTDADDAGGTPDGDADLTPDATQDTKDTSESTRDASDDAERTSQRDANASQDTIQQVREVVASHRRVAEREVELTGDDSAGRVLATLEDIEAVLDDTQEIRDE